MRAKPSAEDAAADWTAASVEAAAVRLLARREHSRVELGRKLRARGAPAELVEEVLASLAARRLQSDERFAESLVTSRIGRGQGPVRIGRDLEAQGVPAAEVEAALEAAGADWFELAAATRRKRFGRPAPADWKERGRQARFLEYRGFTAEQIRRALGDDDTP
jgi:regulatory protein